MSIASVLDKLSHVLREATEARQFIWHTVIPRLEAIQKGQAELLTIARLTLRQDTDAKTLAAWRQLAEERGDAAEKLYKVRALLPNSVTCACDYRPGSGNGCLACRIGEAVGK